MIVWGISAYSHDASIAVIRDKELVFASQSERFSGKKNDKDLNNQIFLEAAKYGIPETVVYYENPKLKRKRYLNSKQYKNFFTEFPILKTHKLFRDYLGLKTKIEFLEHHESHAGLAYLSPFDESAVLVIDSIGEFDTISIWNYSNGKLSKVESIKYPTSLGLFYSAFTKGINLIPNEEEYIMMGMAAFGKPKYVDEIKDHFFTDKYELKFNLHKGIGDYTSKFESTTNVASSVQKIMEEAVLFFARKAKKLTNQKNLIYAGGCALNCCINTKLYDIFDNVWIFPNPGDSGSSVGAAAKFIGSKISWNSPYLGYEIEGIYNHELILKSLLKNNVVAVANGRAEFGPRALGNRSIFGNPKLTSISDKVNVIKKREKFRPFAPVILEEFFHDYFEVPERIKDSKYMQFVYPCKLPNKYPGIVHVDGTSRVQTVNEKDNSNLYNLLKDFCEKTGCPMLLNTSLNIKGFPIVNNELDAFNFSKYYGLRVF